MELDEEGLTYNPSLEMGDENGFLSLIEGLINDLYNVARLIPRLAKGRINYKVSLGLLPSFGISLLGRQLCWRDDDSSECDSLWLLSPWVPRPKGLIPTPTPPPNLAFQMSSGVLTSVPGEFFFLLLGQST